MDELFRTNRSEVMNQKQEAKRYFSLLIKLGLTMVTCIGAGFSIGLVTFKLLPIGGVTIIAGVFLGVGLGFYLVVLQIKKDSDSYA